jgi:hypothetical protein
MDHDDTLGQAGPCDRISDPHLQELKLLDPLLAIRLLPCPAENPARRLWFAPSVNSDNGRRLITFLTSAVSALAKDLDDPRSETCLILLPLILVDDPRFCDPHHKERAIRTRLN